MKNVEKLKTQVTANNKELITKIQDVSNELTTQNQK